MVSREVASAVLRLAMLCNDQPSRQALRIIDDALTAAEEERDRLREAAKKVRPAVAHRLRELRAKNDERSFELTNDLAEFNAALQEDRDE